MRGHVVFICLHVVGENSECICYVKLMTIVRTIICDSYSIVLKVYDALLGAVNVYSPLKLRQH